MPSWDLVVNGERRSVEAEPDTPLLWVLRDQLQLTGAKYSCGEGYCGACTVLMDGEVAKSCLLRIEQAGGREITTIEGLSVNGDHPLQRAWLEQSVSQCGYCQPGQILTAAALLADNPDPSDEEIIDAMRGNLCRCGSYQRIRHAIRAVSGGGAR